MRISFWPDRAWSNLVGPAWPWIASDEAAAFAARVRPALDPYWEQRLTLAPSLLLTDRAKALVTRARASITPTTLGGSGFEKVEAAAAGDADAFWFFELGSTAWMLTLRRLRREGWMPLEPPGVDLEALEQVWRDYGPGHAIAAMDPALASDPASHPALALYRVPLALWHERNPQAGMQYLDRAIAKLTPQAVQVMGMTLPLTYALLHALTGNTARGADLLAEGRIKGRPNGWAGLGSTEVRYQRARYLWDLRRLDEAIELLKKVMGVDATYAIRVMSDPAWLDAGVTNGSSMLLGAIGEVLGRARSQIVRFQQSRTRADDEIPDVRRIVDALEFAGDEAYMVLSAASRLPAVDAQRQAQVTVGQAFYADLEHVQGFAKGLPGPCTLRLGAGFRPRFAGTPDSDIAHLEGLLDDARFADASEYLEQLTEELPYALRVATISYAQRLVTALATAADVLRARRREADKPRFLKLVELSERCLALVEPIRALPDDVGSSLLYQTQKVWEEMLAIEKAWVKYEARMFGQLTLHAPEELRPITRGGWIAYAFRVTDAAGQPVAGVPIVWQVASGPAFAKDPIAGLEGEWALSLQTGVAYVTVEARGVGAGGVIEAMVLGGHSPVSVRYAVVDPTESTPA